VNAVGADHFGMLLNFCSVDHVGSPCMEQPSTPLAAEGCMANADAGRGVVDGPGCPRIRKLTLCKLSGGAALCSLARSSRRAISAFRRRAFGVAERPGRRSVLQ